jgi:putative transposase
LEAENNKLKKFMAKAHMDIHTLKSVFGVKRFAAFLRFRQYVK